MGSSGSRTVTVKTDHKPLLSAFDKPDVSPRIFRLLQYLSQWSIDVQYVEGPANVAADILSRQLGTPAAARVKLTYIDVAAGSGQAPGLQKRPTSKMVRCSNSELIHLISSSKFQIIKTMNSHI